MVNAALKRQRLGVDGGARVDALVADLERLEPNAERELALVVDIILAQLREVAHLAAADAPAAAAAAPTLLESAPATEDGLGRIRAAFAPEFSPDTRVSDVLDSRLATLMKGWIFRHMQADVSTVDVLESTVAQLATLVHAGRRRPLGAAII